MSIIDDIREQNPQSLVVKADKGKKKLIVVESATKAKEIMHFLDSNWKALPTKGWIKDIIQPKDVKPDDKPDYGRYGINVNNMDEMLSYVPGGMKMLSAIRTEINTGNYDTLICSGDPDRAGSGISAQIAEFLAKDTCRQGMKTVRACWHEITRKAVVEGLANAVEMKDDRNAVEAERARMEFDRLFGYSVSPLLWRAVAAGTSGGRAQSPALRLVVERERKRMNFVSASYYGIDGVFQTGSEQYAASLVSIDSMKIATGSSFNDDGQVKQGHLVLDVKQANAHMKTMKTDDWKVADITEKAYRKRPPAPYKTSTFQQDVGNKLGIGSKQVMNIAQKLFENSVITYLRTNSSDLSLDGAKAAHALAMKTYGKQNVKQGYQYVEKPGSGSALDGHEAIRPVIDDNTGSFKTPAQLKAKLDRIDNNAFRVYDMIYRRTLASQMNDATGTTVTISLKNQRKTCSHDYIMHNVGTIMINPGWTIAMSDDERPNPVPSVKTGDNAKPISMKATEHKTTPPARYTEPQLVAKLEELGIGRPATYAQIVSVNKERDYVNKKNKALYPTWRGMQVAQLLEAKIPDFIAYAYTADMETYLDDINTGKLGRVDFLKARWKEIDSKVNNLASNIDYNEINMLSTIQLNNGYHVECTKFGFKLVDENGIPDATGKLPSVKLDGDELYDGMDADRCKQLMTAGKQAFHPRVLGVLQDGAYAGYQVTLRDGKYGKYAQAIKLNKNGEPVKTAKPVNMTIPDSMDAVNATLDDVSALFMEVKLPRRFPDGLFVGEGKKGAYIGFSKGKTRRAKATFVSLQDGVDPRTVSHDDVKKYYDEAMNNKKKDK